MGSGRSQTPCTLPCFHTPPSHAPLPTLQRDSLRPWPCETALCRLALLISSLPLSPSKVEGRTTTPPVENCWMVRKTTAIPPTSPDPDPDPDPDHTAGSLSRSNASRPSSFFLLSQHPLPTTIRHHPTTPPRTLPSGLPSLSGHTACKKAGKELGSRIVATRGVCPVSNTATFDNHLRPFSSSTCRRHHASRSALSQSSTSLSARRAVPGSFSLSLRHHRRRQHTPRLLAACREAEALKSSTLPRHRTRPRARTSYPSVCLPRSRHHRIQLEPSSSCAAFAASRTGSQAPQPGRISRDGRRFAPSRLWKPRCLLLHPTTRLPADFWATFPNLTHDIPDSAAAGVQSAVTTCVPYCDGPS